MLKDPTHGLGGVVLLCDGWQGSDMNLRSGESLRRTFTAGMALVDVLWEQEEDRTMIRSEGTCDITTGRDVCHVTHCSSTGSDRARLVR
jgi:hypothetical protein